MPLRRETGRLRWALSRHLRHCELRWVGEHRQWVLSGVQCGYWTGMDLPEAHTRVMFYPLRRTVS